jgi:menaquinone-dependent protoporphyrinogen oxidase
MGSVMVGYVTKTNTTKEIAERIGEKLKKAGFAVDVKSLDTVESLDTYDGVVLGSPVNAMRLLPEFSAFVAGNPGVAGKTAGLFAVTYIYDHGRKLFRNMMQGSFKKARLATKARAMAVFGGRIAEPMPAPARLIFGLQRDLPLDLRNWDRIEEWADKVAVELRDLNK